MKSLKILIATAIALCATSAWASMPCDGTVYFKLPDGWKSAYAVGGGNGVPFTKSPYNNWLQVSTSDIGKGNSIDYFFINEDKESACLSSGHCVRKDSMDVPYLMFSALSNNSFTCSDFGSNGELWIMAHPDPKKAHVTYVSPTPPDVKYLYVYLPQNKAWWSSTPLINEDGIDRLLEVDPDHCGWYYRRYIDEKIPSSVLIHMDNDEKPYKQAIGLNGSWEETPNNPESIPLQSLYDIFLNEPGYNGNIYFVADENAANELPYENKGWFAVYPDIEGVCSLELSATIYDTDASLHPSFSCWYYLGEGCQAIDGKAAQNVDSTVAITAINSCIGVTQGIVESKLDAKTKKPTLSTAGKKCFIDDKYFNQLFTYTENINEKTFFTMPFYRTTDGKWEFDSDYYTSPGLNNPVMGGFYPAEGKTDAMVLAADPKQKPVPAARTKRMAEGPVFWGPALRQLDPAEGVAKIDVLCKGPAWSNGMSCDGLFADGTSTEEAIQSYLKLTSRSECVFGWSCSGYDAPNGWPMYESGSETISTKAGYPRWESEEGSKGNGGRNQHFCFESHAKFKFKNGLKFSIRGDDDIWVFIDNKLAVDLGGTHLSAPGYVDLDAFMKDAKVGSTYDIDIFFCDRRTTMSNMRISTNIFMDQNEEFSPDISSSSSKNPSSSSSQKSGVNSSSSNKNSKSSSSVSKDSKSSSSTGKSSKSSSSSKNAKSSSSTGKSAKSSSSQNIYAKPSFRVEMVAQFEFDIVFDEDAPSLAKQYAVMDMKGQVLSVGELSGADTRIKVPTSGSYIVNVGYTCKQVNVK